MNDRITRGGQIKVYLGKCFRIFRNEKGWKVLVSAAIIGLILSWVVGDKTFRLFESTKSGMFAMVCGCIWIGLFNSIQSICKERAIIKREHRSGLHISSYILAHAIYELILCAVEAIILLVLLAMFRDLPDEGAIFDSIYPEYYIAFLLTLFCSDCLGLCVSSIVKSTKTAMTVMPFVLIIQLVMSGMLFQLPESAEWVSKLTISKWGQDALCCSADINRLKSRQLEELEDYDEDDMTEKMIYEYFRDDSYNETGHEYFEDYDPDNTVLTWFALLGYSTLYTAAAIGALELVDKDKR